jgi:glycine dehydrogenase subunit 1
MLAAIGVASIADLFSDIPAAHRFPELDVPPGQSEWEAWTEMRRLAARNQDLDHYPCFLGAGAYRHFVPGTIGHLVSRGEFLTSYTPYQPEVAQGTLQAIYEFQSLVCELTGMDVANSAMYDGATAPGRSGAHGVPLDEARARADRRYGASVLAERARHLFPWPRPDD